MLDKFKIGHYTDVDNGTGVTVILAEEGAVGGVSVRGAAPATRETDLLRPDKTVQKINAVVLSGGSAFGLEASCGVMRFLKDEKIGFSVNGNLVPIVCGASIYDLDYKKPSFPDISAGIEACKNAVVNNFDGGAIGAGTGATVGKARGARFSDKSGIGMASIEDDGFQMCVIVCVNAFGDIVDNGQIIAGTRNDDGNFADSSAIFASENITTFNSNTIIGCIITNANLNKVETNVLADLAHDGLAQAVCPSHTMLDGDAFFCMASGEVMVPFNRLTAIIPSLIKRAIINSVKQDKSVK